MFGRTSYLGLPSFGTTCSSHCDLSYCDGSVTVLLGTDAGVAQRGTQLVAIGGGAAESNSGTEVVAVGLGAGSRNSGDSVVALGTDAALSNSGDYVSAVGENAASSNEGSEVVALGHNAGSQADVGGILGRAWRAVTSGETTGSNIYALEWSQIASSADGNIIVASAYGSSCNNSDATRLILSRDSGATWTQVTNIGSDASYGYSSVNGWSSVATDYSGANIYAVEEDSAVWKSSDSGSNWEEIAPASGSSNWKSVSCSSNGQTVVLGEDGGDSDLYVSLDGGCNWQLQNLSGSDWRSVVVSADGKRALVGDTDNSNLQIGALSSNNTWSWTVWNAVDPSNAGQPAEGFWHQLAMSSNGKYMYAADDFTLWRSKDFGSNWQTIGIINTFRGVACSADGQIVLTAQVPGGGPENPIVQLSSNYGSNFVTLSQCLTSSMLNDGPTSVCMDASGTKFALVGSNTPIFINPLPSNIVSVGHDSGSNNIGSDVILIGTSAGAANVGLNAIAIGSNAGVRNGLFTEAVYDSFSTYSLDSLFPTKSNAISIGTRAGSNGFGVGMISIGENAGANTAGGNTVFIGKNAGVSLSGSVLFSTVAIGEGAASDCAPLTYGLVAIGSNAGKGDRTLQGSGGDPFSLLNGTVSIGNRAGQGNCAASVNIGTGAGTTNSTYNAISIGSNAGGGVNAEWGYSNVGWTYGAAVSSNGEYMFSTQDYADNANGYILRNSNYGDSGDWETVNGDYYWRDIACTGDGINVIACESDGGGYLWFSSDYGTGPSWHTDGGFDLSGNAVHNGFWRCVAVAQSNPYIIFAGESNNGEGSLWQSTDGGATLTQIAEVGVGNWRSVKCDASGGYVIAVDSDNSNAWVRDPSGTWTNVTNLPQDNDSNVPSSRFWACAISSNGQYMYVAGNETDFGDDGAVWGSSNYGSNWTWMSTDFNGLPADTYYRSLACSGDGQVVWAGVGSGGDQYVYRSTDAGITWARSGSANMSGSWGALACDSDTGRQVLGAARWGDGGVWTTTIPEMYDTVAIGTRAGSNSIGADNIFLGYAAGTSNLDGKCIAIGSNAGYQNEASNVIFLGNNPSGANQTPGFDQNNTFLVYSTGGNGGIATYTDLSNSRLGIACSPGSYALNVSGDAIVSGTITGTVVAPPSDRTLKQEIVTTTLGLDFVKSLKPVDYKFIDKPEALRHGFIAQDVQEVAPELVHTHPHTEKLGLEITDIIAPLVKAVQELSAEVADLKAQVARLQA